MSREPGNLSKILAKEIEANGPISIADYMRAANKEYYASCDPFGVDGDFITAPEVSQIFGELIGLWLTDFWMRQGHPKDCHYVELGPGRGSLAADALRSMARFDFSPDVYFVENSEALQAAQASQVPRANIVTMIDDLPDDGALLIIANEFFDALPARQLVATDSGWRENLVTFQHGKQFKAIAGSQPMDAMVPAEFRSAEVDSVYESSAEVSGILYELSGRIAQQGGVLLIIDYGYASPGLGSTLQAVKSHKMVDPFENPGEYDLTVHVNFLEMANLARMRNLRVSGPVEQGPWLSALGINARADMLAVASPERAEDINKMRERLVDPTQMGSLFKVLAISSPDWPVPEGFVTDRPDI